MKFIIPSFILAGLASANVAFTNSDFSDIEAGKPFEITWSGATGPVTITLKSGPSDNLHDVASITSGQSGESFTWTPSSSLPSGTDYALEITDGTDINYSVQFPVEGGAAASSSSGTSSSAVSSKTASSSASSTVSTASTTSSSSESSSSTSSIVSTSSVNSTTSVTSSSTRTSATSATSATTTGTPTSIPDTNGAQGIFAPLVAPLLMAIGVAFF